MNALLRATAARLSRGPGRWLAVYLFAVVVLAVLAGPRWHGASRDNHFVYMASGWLEGRVALDGRPPGYCDARDRAAGKCKGHRFDDWALLTTLTFDDGSTARAFPCSTKECEKTRRGGGPQRWWVAGEGWRDIESRSIRSRAETWYVSFPPGPAVVMVPAVAAFGLDTPDVLITLLLGALIPVVLVRLLDRERPDAPRGDHLWLAAAWLLASPALLLAANGRVWFTGQIVGALALMLYLDAGWRARRPVLAGVWLGLAVACRPINHLPAVIVFLSWWWRDGRRLGPLLRFAIPLAAIGGALAYFNWIRFDDIFEFGHRYLQTRWQARIQELGLFDASYVGRNLQCLLSLMPQLGGDLPGFRVSIHGTALWLGSPWLFLLRARAFVGEGLAALWIAVLASALPSIAYQNSGQVQISYRFAVDWLPMVVVAMGLGGLARRRVFAVLVVAGALFHVTGSWYFARQTGRIFVTDPPGWPFEDELADK